MEDDLSDIENNSGEQRSGRERQLAALKPYQYKKGQSGNPAGRAKGISLKEYVKNKFAHMTDEERESFLEGVSKDFIWEMGEDKAQSKTDITTMGKELPAPIINVSRDNSISEDKQPE